MNHVKTLLPLLLAVNMIVGCQPDEPWTSDNPEFALDKFLSALRMGDRDTVREFLSDDTRNLLDQTAAASRQALGPDNNVPDDSLALLYRVWTPAAEEIDHFETIAQSDEHAIVAVHSVFGDVSSVHMTRAAGRWTIDLTVANDPDHQGTGDP